MDRCEACDNADTRRLWFKTGNRWVFLCDPCLGYTSNRYSGSNRRTCDTVALPHSRRDPAQLAKIGLTTGG